MIVSVRIDAFFPRLASYKYWIKQVIYKDVH